MARRGMYDRKEYAAPIRDGGGVRSARHRTPCSLALCHAKKEESWAKRKRRAVSGPPSFGSLRAHAAS